MNPIAIFYPVITLALWTVTVLAMVGLRRVNAASRREVSPKDFRLGESANVPAAVSIPNRNYMNLLEAPVLFYLVSIVLFVTNHADRFAVALAWCYVATRMLHSLVHLSYNNVLHRLVVFAVSNFILVTMWIRLALAL